MLSSLNMPGNLKPGVVALCDAVYKDEATNKIVIAGLYAGNVITDGAPHDMRFALYAEFVLPDNNPHDLDIQFWIGKVQVGSARSQVLQPPEAPNVSLMLNQFTLQGTIPGTLSIKACLDGGRPIKILEKDLLLRSPTA